MCESLWHVHTVIRPKLVEDLEAFTNKVRIISSPEELDAFLAEIGSSHGAESLA